MSTTKRRTNWNRVDELNAILGPVVKEMGYHFSILKNAREFSHPYCVVSNGQPYRSLDYKGMKEIALRMRSIFDNGGDSLAVGLSIMQN